MPNDSLFSVQAITALARIMDGYQSDSGRVGLGIGTHADLDDFFGAVGLEVADEPSIAKKIRATLNRANS
ncbi:MAG: hypothetical protein GXP29_08890, partial [Planctomycetes bacterium]|nr:hypothetical protein [Planctomycetota bacterium]